MGDFHIKEIKTKEERNEFYKQILTDLDVFDFMLENDLIDSGNSTIGAEQEITIIDKYGNPKPDSTWFLNHINDSHFTNELALFDLEINLDPVDLKGKCFTDVESTLLNLMEKGGKLAAKNESSLYLTGILPTIVKEHLDFSYMTPVERYKVLSCELLKLRGRKFQIFLQGVDDLNLRLDSILFEACNTSFQVHLQINPANFKTQYNWAQMISGPVLSCCTNSPLLFGKELWAENRIALFKQSLDTRNFNSHYREKVPRVYFGVDWLEGKPSDLWKNDVARFPLVFRGEGEENSREQLSRGVTPLLKAVRLHNGTTYTWNRLCYGVQDNIAHIRLENRYMPAGPTVKDEIANMVLWTGLMKSNTYDSEFWKNLDFRESKANFYKAARTGMDTMLDWFGNKVSAKKLLIETLIPLASKGLKDSNVNHDDIDHYLGIIENRVLKQNSGSDWTIRNFRSLTSKFKPVLASKILVSESLKMQIENIPVSEWDDISNNKLQHYFAVHFDTLKIADVMSTQLYTITDDVTVDLALKIMEWRLFHHIIVEDSDFKFKGIVSKDFLLNESFKPNTLIRDLDLPKVQVISPGDLVSKVQLDMKANNDSAMVVVEDSRVVGIVTRNDI
ncbi:MAG: CBS domain-containing protein [Saprospiraceae bacterium]|nr:CBS domain-containing protein [Saprospiraceae bacterium]